MHSQNQHGQTVTLFFPNLNTLWAFTQTLATHNLEINARTFSLTCTCTTEEINRAFLQFNATGLKEEQTVHSVRQSNNSFNSSTNL